MNEMYNLNKQYFEFPAMVSLWLIVEYVSEWIENDTVSEKKTLQEKYLELLSGKTFEADDIQIQCFVW